MAIHKTYLSIIVLWPICWGEFVARSLGNRIYLISRCVGQWMTIEESKLTQMINQWPPGVYIFSLQYWEGGGISLNSHWEFNQINRTIRQWKNASPSIVLSIAGHPLSAKELKAIRSLHHTTKSFPFPSSRYLCLREWDSCPQQIWQFCSWANKAPWRWRLLGLKWAFKVFWK